MKEFKSNDELINYLISKGVTVNNKDDAILKIKKYTYYSIINSYKYIFKYDDGSYKENVNFNEIFSLFEFDKHIKIIFLKYALHIEMVFKSLMANQIAENYNFSNYLDINNLDSSVNKLTKQNLIKKINEEIDKNYGIHPAITHYKNTYGFIPPFVLVKILSFGLASSYYGLLNQSDRQTIAKYFNISDKLLKQILKNLTNIRNISAHSDRLYSFRNKYTLSFKIIDKTYKPQDNFTNLYMIIKILKLILNDEEYLNFENELNNEIDILNKNLHSISINDVLRIMGYPNV